MASIYTVDDTAYAVAESPLESLELVKAVDASEGEDWVTFTLANTNEWNGKPLYLRASDISGISPPMRINRDDE